MNKYITLILLTLVILVIPEKLFANNDKLPQSYDSALEAQKDLQKAVNSESKVDLTRVLGSDGKELIFSGDKNADRAVLKKFAKRMQQENSLVADGNSKMFIKAGKNAWIFPIPIVKTQDKWHFDVNQGKEEILNRRIGENEINAIKISRFYIDAQKIYYSQDHDNDGVNEYAKKFLSTAGKRDGLYWKAQVGTEASPFGPLVKKAIKEGYKKNKNDTLPLYKGYYYKYLFKQGSNAQTGKKEYLDSKQNLTEGFALVAFPTQWGNSGIMSFIVNQDGKVYEKNLGEDTNKIATKIGEFNPDKSWSVVE